jgi:hypothetical protein
MSPLGIESSKRPRRVFCAVHGFAPAYVFAPGYTGFETARFEASIYAVVATASSGPD